MAIASVLVMVTAGAAFAQTPDGGGPSGAASETRNSVICLSDVATRIITEDAPTTTTNTVFSSFVGITVHVPANTTRCLLVEFNAETACWGDAGASDDFCYLRALANGVEMLPVSGGFMSFMSDDFSAESNSTRWVRRLAGGPSGTNYSIQVQRRSDSSGTNFYLDDWMFSIKILF